MKKIYLIGAGIILIILIITSILLSLQKKSAGNALPNSPFPTSIPGQGLNQPNSQSSTNPGIQNTGVAQDETLDISTIAPVETADFKLQYSPSLNKVVVEKKTAQADEQFVNWASENQKTELVTNPDLTLMVDQGKNPADYNPLIRFLNIFLNFGQGMGSPAGNSSSTNSTNPTNSTSSTSSTNSTNSTIPNLIYYPQCGGEFDNLALPGGCTLCKAGCGPTTVAMIASSYLGNNFTPKTIVNLYQSKGYTLDCSGSRFTDAYNLLKQLGLKTTDPIAFNLETADKVVPDLRKYLDAGWTFFTNANFCSTGNGCGHFFWITDIDNQGNIYAYDPVYGRYQIPYNENSRSPYPLYKYALGVKK
jgi:hypothetical protein